MERLSDKLACVIEDSRTAWDRNEESVLKSAIDRLAYYEDMEEQGRLKILPCAVGDTIWDKEVEPWNVISVEWFSRKVTHLHCVSPVTGRRGTFAIGKRSLGKTVFLTREEAEQALKGGADRE